ncbi:amino acid permease [Amnibacterium sp. CER49]|uniref:APC family permease n=1 Tax=Amnibacterium sp. CER49 TaxID=3039161 RepID=UPI00244B7879|nr:amino acid permease [Amnibacterium sp. CER49]MDH2443509.1 amino acid permease [Amnibacterium sp. CER49]
MDAADATTPPRGGVGVVRASALYVASVFGSGVLVLPSLTVRAAGPAAILSVTAMLALSIPLAATFAALAARYPDAGGVASFLRRAFGSLPARAAGYLFFFGVGLGPMLVGWFGAGYLCALLPGLQPLRPLVAVVLLVAPLVLNWFGVRVSSAAQLVLTAALLAIVAWVVIAALPQMRPARWTPFLPHSWSGVAIGISLNVWAFAGWEAVTHLAGEFRRPRTTVPAATAIALLVTGGAYLALQAVTIGVLGSSAGRSDIALLEIVSGAWGRLAGPLTSAVAVLVVVGVLSTYLAAFANLGAALALEGDLPRWLAVRSTRNAIPRRSLAAVGVLSCAYFLVLAGADFDVQPFVLGQTASNVLVYGGGMAAAVRLLPRRSPAWWTAVLASILVAALVLIAGAALAVPVILCALAGLVQLGRRRRRDRRVRAVPGATTEGTPR